MRDRTFIPKPMPSDTPIEHHAGMLVFKGRADLSLPVVVEIPDWLEQESIELEMFGTAVAGFIAWHRSNIWKQLGYFAGYDNIKFKFEQVADD